MKKLNRINKAILLCLTTSNSYSTLANDESNPNKSDSRNSNVETIIVTAEHKVSSIQETALSLTVKDGEEIQQQGKYLLSDILEDVPGITGGASTQVGNTTGSGTDTPSAGLTIRGIPSNIAAGGSNISVAPAAAIYVDGVYQGIGGTYDIDRVEVLRGPQGTLYGRSATSGLVAIHTKDPVLNEFNGLIQVEMGNYNNRRYMGAINAPLIDDKLAIRIAGNFYSRDGFYSSKGGYLENEDYRLKMLYQPTDELSILLGYSLSDNVVNSGGVSISPSLENPDKLVFDYNQDLASGGTPVNEGGNKTNQLWLTLNWESKIGLVTYQGAIRDYEQALDSTYSANVILAGYATTPESKFITNEFRLSSDVDDDLTWQMGFLTYNHNLQSYNENYQVNADGTQTLAFISDVPNKKTSALGLFGEMTYSFSDSIRLTAGLRYDITKVSGTQSLEVEGATNSISEQKEFKNLNYKLRFEYDVSDNNLLYASVSTGFTPGDISLYADNNAINLEDKIVVNEYEDKTMTSYEIGSKNQFFDGDLTWNLAAYYLDYEGYQVGDFEFSLGLGLPFSRLVTIPMEVKGIESELKYYISDSDKVGFNFAYTDAKFVDTDELSYGPFTNPFLGFEYEVKFNDLHGLSEVHRVPDFTSTFTYDHEFYFSNGSSLNFGIDILYVSEYLGGPIRDDLIEDGRRDWISAGDAFTTNVNATWAPDDYSYSITAYVRNVTDEQYIVSTGAYGKDGVPPSGLVLQSQVNNPRTYGVVVNINF